MVTTANKGLAEPGNGDLNWDVPLNANFVAIDKAFGSSVSISAAAASGNVALTLAQYQCLILSFSGTPAGDVVYQVPSGVGGQWIIRNLTSGSFTLSFGVSGGASVSVPQNSNLSVFSNGSGAFSTLGAPLSLQSLSAATDTVTNVLSLNSQSSGTPAAGIGTGLAFLTETAAGNTETGMMIHSVASDVSSGAEDFDLVVKLMSGGAAAAEVVRVTPAGAMELAGDAVITAGKPAATQSLTTAGIVVSAANDGIKSGGTYTPTPIGGNMKYVVNDGAFTLGAPTEAGDYTMVIQITNSASAGAVTFSGFTKAIGDNFTTTSGHDFFVYVTKCNGFTLANVVALQ